jgi:hypothetical protein
MKHFLVTRFNYFDSYKHMEQRLWLFNKFTRPSIEAQTSKNFEWLILGQPPLNIPIEEVKHSFHEVNKGIMGIEYLNYIKEVTRNEDLVLMTRLDNDDMLMPTYIEDMQKVAKQPNHIYEYMGYRLDTRNGAFYIDTRHSPTITSPFTTLASIPSNLQSIYAHNHSHMWKFYKLHILEKRNWVQIIHNHNWVLGLGGVEDTARRGTLTEDVPDFVRKLMVMEAG